MIQDQYLLAHGENPFRVAAETAHAYARAFLEWCDSETFFKDQDFTKHETACPQVTTLSLFAYQVFGLRVLPFNDAHRQGYASWLMKSSPATFNIAVFPRQMTAWWEANGVPRPVQFIRSIIHEIGHYKLSKYVTSDPSTPGFSPAASPEEEEKAWVFTFLFLAILVGDYSYRRRKSIEDCDDCPKLMI